MSKLLTRIGHVPVGGVYWTDKLDGGPFRLLSTDEPARKPMDPTGRRYDEGKSFAVALRVDDGGLVTMDATHPAWVLPQRKVSP